MFINFTNHPSENWDEKQRQAAEAYGEIVDIQFPLIDDDASEDAIDDLVKKYLRVILDRGEAKEMTVHIMGEQTFCYALISRLQKKGVRCVASCTTRNNYTNESGETVRTFVFSRFREYDLPKTLALKRWLTAQNKRVVDVFRRCPFLFSKKTYSTIALVSVLLSELLLVSFLQLGCPILRDLAIGVACVLPLLLLLGRFFGQRFGIASPLVTKLLANAVTPSFLGTLYLFVFVIHIGWLTNAVLGLYTAEGDAVWRVWLSTSVCFLGIFFLIIFFPKGNEQKVEVTQKVFVSGISAITTREQDLAKMTYDGLNLLPLVRILQLAKKDPIVPRFVILQTDAFKDTPDYGKALNHVMELVNEEACPLLEKCKDVNKKLELIIREVAKREFPNLAEKNSPDDICFIDMIPIEFTAPCSYTKHFDQAYSIIDERIKNLDDPHHSLYFNLTPGTGIIGSLMTLLAIDGDRHLYYYSQEPMPKTISDEKDKRAFREKLVLSVDKSKVPLHALLSQALEKQD